MSNQNQAAVGGNVTLTQAQYEELMRKASQAGKPKRETTKLIDGFSCAVSEKGAISIYGFGRWPVTLYASQLKQLAVLMPAILAFANANADKLTTKPVAVK